MTAITLENIETGYGKKMVLFGVSLEVRRGEIVALIGPNGAGKSTVLNVVCGVLPLWRGRMRLHGRLVRFSSPADSVASSVGYAPQGNRVFTELTVKENLEMGGYSLKRQQVAKRMYVLLDMFPQLHNRLGSIAGRLSGGEQQMLAFARALMTEPELLLLDEPSLGLSPQLISLAFKQIVNIRNELNTAILIVEQKVRKVLAVSDRVYALKLGKVIFEGRPNELLNDSEKLRSIFL